MYFRTSSRKNPATNQTQTYWRLVESYRNEFGRVCHRTLHSVGFIDFELDKLATIQAILNDRHNNKKSLFEESDQEALALANKYWDAMVANKKVDVSPEAYQKSKRLVDIDTIEHTNAREIGAEWLCYQALEQLGMRNKLESLGWQEEEIQLAITQIISRAVYPFSENKTSRIIRENSAVCEVTGYPIEKMTKDKLYKSALKLYNSKDDLEQYLSHKTNELFDLDDKIYLYDLTNTYFEGRKQGSKIAKYGRSKEKRSDCKLVVLGMVVNTEGFVKYSNIFEGNTSDSASLPMIIDNLRAKTSDEKRAVIVLDAGIATKENLALIEAKGYDYVCVSRSKIKDYVIDQNHEIKKITTKNHQSVYLQKIVKEGETDYLLKVKSDGKTLKESSMKDKLTQRFLLEIEKINKSLSVKYGVKKADKVNQRLGKVLGKYPSIAKFYDTEVEVDSKNNLATRLICKEKASSALDNEELGAYFIRTNLNTKDETSLWTIYNSIREIESTFRCLKTDLDLRPIYHKNDESTMAHLHLGILGYWLVNTIRHQLKIQKITHDWQEIVRMASTQKILTTSGQNKENETIYVRKCTEPNEKLKRIYAVLHYKNKPFFKRKSVVLKT